MSNMNRVWGVPDKFSLDLKAFQLVPLSEVLFQQVNAIFLQINCLLFVACLWFHLLGLLYQAAPPDRCVCVRHVCDFSPPLPPPKLSQKQINP